MDINGTATISIKDLDKLRSHAKDGLMYKAQHELIFKRLSQFVTSLIYDGDIPQEAVEAITDRVRMLSEALPEVDFYHNKNNAQIILKLNEEAVREQSERTNV